MTLSAQGIDVSNYQGRFNWSAAATAEAKAGRPLVFGLCRATQGLGGSGTNSPDPHLAWNWQQIHAHGLYRGAYHFLNPALSGGGQAEYFVRTLEGQSGGVAGTDILILDHEVKHAGAAATAQAFMHELVTLMPHNPRAVYINLDMARTGYGAGLGSYPLHIAAYQNSAPSLKGTPWGAWHLWQFGDSPWDLDAYNGTAGDLKKWISSYGGPAAPVSAPVSSQPVMRNGSTGAAVRTLQERLNAWGASPQLKVDGDFGPATGNAVRAFQESQGLSVDGVAGPQTNGALAKTPKTWTYGPPQNLRATGGKTSVKLTWSRPAYAPQAVDHYEVYVYKGTTCSKATQVASYPRAAKSSPWQGGGLAENTRHTAHVVACGKDGAHVRPYTYAQATFTT